CLFPASGGDTLAGRLGTEPEYGSVLGRFRFLSAARPSELSSCSRNDRSRSGGDLDASRPVGRLGVIEPLGEPRALRQSVVGLLPELRGQHQLKDGAPSRERQQKPI